MKSLPRFSLGLLAAWILVSGIVAPRLVLGAEDAAGPRALPVVQVTSFGTVPAPRKMEIQPKLTDGATTVAAAANRREILDLLGVSLSKAQEAFLDTHKFLVVPKSATRYKGQVSFSGAEPQQWDEMLGMHDEICGGYNPWDRKPENAHLITPDVVLHAFHKYLENSLEQLEKTALASTVREFVGDVRDQALAASRRTTGPAAQRLQMLAAQFTVPCVLLDNALWTVPRGMDADGNPLEPADDKDTYASATEILDGCSGDLPEKLAAEVDRELELIYAAEGRSTSPLFGSYASSGSLETDYSQFKPRSHYATSSALRAYFRAMIYLGRNSWLFETEQGLGDAALLAWVLAGTGRQGKPILDNWKKVMEMTGFFAGAPDDVGYPQWRDFLAVAAGRSELTPEQALQPEFLKKLSGSLDKLAPPRILSEVRFSEEMPQTTKEALLAKTKGFRVFGQRFSFDGWVLGRLTAGQEKTVPKLPSTPSAVFVAAAFGDPLARLLSGEILQAWNPEFSKDDVQAFLGKLDEVAKDLAKVTEEEWFSSASAAWLKVLGTLTGTWGKGYPLYMASPLFARRQLESFLGSFTELKHDMLLYAKQNYAEYGDGGEDEKAPPVPKGFVEPNLPFWYELQRLVEFYRSGLQKQGINTSESEEFSRVESFKTLIEFYTSLAEKELQGTPLTEDEYERLRTEKLSDMARPYGETILAEDQLRAGLIADIHTDAVKNTVLYEATGEPAFLLVLVGNENSPRLVVGPVYNHFEFSEPANTRLGDQEWRERVYQKPDQLPAKPAFYKEILVP